MGQLLYLPCKSDKVSSVVVAGLKRGEGKEKREYPSRVPALTSALLSRPNQLEGTRRRWGKKEIVLANAVKGRCGTQAKGLSSQIGSEA